MELLSTIVEPQSGVAMALPPQGAKRAEGTPPGATAAQQLGGWSGLVALLRLDLPTGTSVSRELEAFKS